MLTCCGVKNPHITLQLALHVWDSASTDSPHTHHVALEYVFIEKESVYKRTHAVQLRGVQESASLIVAEGEGGVWGCAGCTVTLFCSHSMTVSE